MTRSSFVAAVLMALAVTGCGTGEEPSTAADEVIAAAGDAEEAEALRRARDDIDRQMCQVAAGKDAEIERLKRENEELRRRLED